MFFFFFFKPIIFPTGVMIHTHKKKSEYFCSSPMWLNGKQLTREIDGYQNDSVLKTKLVVNKTSDLLN